MVEPAASTSAASAIDLRGWRAVRDELLRLARSRHRHEHFRNIFAVEGEGAFGIIEDEGVELEGELAGFALAKLPLGENFHAFGRIGYSFVDSTLTEDDGFAYGIGGQYNFGKSGLRLDWTRHDFDEDDVDAWSIAYTYTF